MATPTTAVRPGGVLLKRNNSGGKLRHKQIAVIDGIPGLVIKTATHSYDAPIASRQEIAQNERFNFVVKGSVWVPLGSLAVGDTAYIAATATQSNGFSTFPITEATGSGRIQLGPVTEDPTSGRGLPSDVATVNLDLRVQTPGS